MPSTGRRLDRDDNHAPWLEHATLSGKGRDRLTWLSVGGCPSSTLDP